MKHLQEYLKESEDKKISVTFKAPKDAPQRYESINDKSSAYYDRNQQTIKSIKKKFDVNLSFTKNSMTYTGSISEMWRAIKSHYTRGIFGHGDSRFAIDNVESIKRNHPELYKAAIDTGIYKPSKKEKDLPYVNENGDIRNKDGSDKNGILSDEQYAKKMK